MTWSIADFTLTEKLRVIRMADAGKIPQAIANRFEVTPAVVVNILTEGKLLNAQSEHQ